MTAFIFLFAAGGRGGYWFVRKATAPPRGALARLLLRSEAPPRGALLFGCVSMQRFCSRRAAHAMLRCRAWERQRCMRRRPRAAHTPCVIVAHQTRCSERALAKCVAAWQCGATQRWLVQKRRGRCTGTGVCNALRSTYEAMDFEKASAASVVARRGLSTLFFRAIMTLASRCRKTGR